MEAVRSLADNKPDSLRTADSLAAPTGQHDTHDTHTTHATHAARDTRDTHDRGYVMLAPVVLPVVLHPGPGGSSGAAEDGVEASLAGAPSAARGPQATTDV